MPIYEYQCQDCGHELEAIRKISDPPLEECPECGKPALKKKVSAPSFRLKGGGWYETDFKKAGDKKRNIAGEGAEAKSDGGDKKESAGKSEKSDSTGKSSEKSSGTTSGDGGAASKSSTKNQAA